MPIQVKARSGPCYQFQRSWFKVPGIVLVQVRHVATEPEFYIFDGLPRVEEALGPHADTLSWRERGACSVTRKELTPDQLERMKPHGNRWERILD